MQSFQEVPSLPITWPYLGLPIYPLMKLLALFHRFYTPSLSSIASWLMFLSQDQHQHQHRDNLPTHPDQPSSESLHSRSHGGKLSEYIYI